MSPILGIELYIHRSSIRYVLFDSNLQEKQNPAPESIHHSRNMDSKRKVFQCPCFIQYCVESGRVDRPGANAETERMFVASV